MKQGRQFASERMASFDLDMFVVVAALTGERQIVGDGFATTMLGNDMFDGERMRRVSHLAQAVLATALGACDHRRRNSARVRGLVVIRLRRFDA